MAKPYRHVKFMHGPRPEGVIEQIEEVLRMMKEDPELVDQFTEASNGGEDVTVILTSQEEGIGIYAHVAPVPPDGFHVKIPRVGDLDQLFTEEDDDPGFEFGDRGSMN